MGNLPNEAASNDDLTLLSDDELKRELEIFQERRSWTDNMRRRLGILPNETLDEGLRRIAKKRADDALGQSSDKEPVTLHKTFEYAAQVVRQIQTDPDFKSSLIELSAQAGLAMTITSAVPANLLPAQAPALWQDRSMEARINPVQFIRQIYAPWLDAGLMTRRAIYDCDKPLANAYAQWIHRHPEDVLPFAGITKPGRLPEADAQKAIENVRSRSRQSSARYRVSRSLT